MKKQYSVVDFGFARCNVTLYHNGIMVEQKKMWEDEAQDYIDKLEDEGYTHGYTSEEVENARNNYEWRLENMIKEDLY